MAGVAGERDLELLLPLPFKGGLRARPIPMPTRTNVSREARPLINKSSSTSTTPFSNRQTIVDPHAPSHIVALAHSSQTQTIHD